MSSSADAAGELKQPLLEARKLSKSFDGNLVLHDVSLAIRPGEVHAVVGENGAGKSTLIKILGGVYPPDRGELFLDGIEKRLRSPREALASGIVAIHQELSLAKHLSTEENIFLGHFPTRYGAIDRRHMRQRTEQLLGRLSVEVEAGRPVGELSIAQQQMVEIVKALSVEARVLILDEPTAVLDQDRVKTLFTVIGRLRQQGIGIVYISHHLEEIFQIADRVTVLRDGRLTGSELVRDVDQDWLVRRMIGRDFPPHSPHQRNSGNPALELQGLSVPGQFADVSFTVREGEIVGLAGLVGAGRSEIAQAILGVSRPDSGEIKVFGQSVRIPSPNAAARLGIAYVSEDRKAFGLLPNRPVRENMTISSLSRFYRFPFLQLGKERAFVRDMIQRLDIRLDTMRMEIRNLSGGNQQKVLIGRALAVEPRILIFDEPTRGVDIGAKQEIYAFIEKLVAQGMAILLISSEMEEILRLSDRVIVLRRGRVASVLSRESASETTIMRAAALA